MKGTSQLLNDVGLLLEVDGVLLHLVLAALARGELHAELGGRHVEVEGVVLPLQGAVGRAAPAVALRSLLLVGLRTRLGTSQTVFPLAGGRFRLSVDGGRGRRGRGRRRRRGLEVRHVREATFNHNVVRLKILVRLLVHDEQLGLVVDLLDALHHLLVVLVGDVDAVHLHDAVALPEPRGLGRGALVHLPDELARLALLGVQVEAVAVKVRPLHDVAQARGGRARRLQGGVRLHAVAVGSGRTVPSVGVRHDGLGGLRRCDSERSGTTAVLQQQVRNKRRRLHNFRHS